ncbi:MAG: hypothetical protein RL291_447 [Pseudomonadota bacterium]|jgi:hypothetical protein
MFKSDPALIDRRDEQGPFDVIGDVHGCYAELVELLSALGYTLSQSTTQSLTITAPKGRRAVFVGDYADRGPDSPAVLRLVMAMLEQRTALAIPGNHDYKLWRWLNGRQVTTSHGFETTMRQFESASQSFKRDVAAFLDTIPTYLWLHDGKLVVSHAGIQEDMIGQADNRTLNHSIYGDTDGKTDSSGLAIRYNWAAAYAGDPFIVYGHVVVPDVAWVNNTACIDTACVYGGRLTALRWPEREIVSVPARQAYYESRREFGLPPPRPKR